MVSEVNATTFGQRVSEMLHQVQFRKDAILIEEGGTPVAALVSAEIFARVRRMQDRFDQVAERISQAYADLPAEEGLAEIDAIISQERHGCKSF